MIRNKKVLVLHHILVSVVLRSILMEEINSNVKIGFYQQKKSNKNQIITTFYFTRTKVEACVLNTKAINFVTAMVHQKRTLKRNISKSFQFTYDIIDRTLICKGHSLLSHQQFSFEFLRLGSTANCRLHNNNE